MSSTMISAEILWITAVCARKPVSESVPPTFTGWPDGAARKSEGAASAVVDAKSPLNTRRRRHAPVRSSIVPSTHPGALFVFEHRFPDVGTTLGACKRFFESFETFEDRYRPVTPR